MGIEVNVPSTSPGKLRRIITDTKDNLRVSVQLHALSVLVGGLCMLTEYIAINEIVKGNVQIDAFLGPALVLLPILVISIIGLDSAKASDNLQHFKTLKRKLGKDGWDESLIQRMQYTYCDRRVAQLAAKDTGFENEMKVFREKLNRGY